VRTGDGDGTGRLGETEETAFEVGAGDDAAVPRVEGDTIISENAAEA
jgi:hypothetical protein